MPLNSLRHRHTLFILFSIHLIVFNCEGRVSSEQYIEEERGGEVVTEDNNNDYNNYNNDYEDLSAANFEERDNQDVNCGDPNRKTCTECLGATNGQCIWCLVGQVCMSAANIANCSTPYTECCVTYSPQGCSTCFQYHDLFQCGWCETFKACRQGNKTGPDPKYKQSCAPGEWMFGGSCPGDGDGDGDHNVVETVVISISVAVGSGVALFVMVLLGMFAVKRWRQREAQRMLAAYEAKHRGGQDPQGGGGEYEPLAPEIGADGRKYYRNHGEPRFISNAAGRTIRGSKSFNNTTTDSLNTQNPHINSREYPAPYQDPAVGSYDPAPRYSGNQRRSVGPSSVDTSDAYSSLAPLIRGMAIEQGRVDLQTLKRIDEATKD